MSDNPQDFKTNFQTLQHIAQQLNTPGELDIDQLVPLVERASRAYQACRARIDAVEQLLEEQLGKTDGPQDVVG